MKTWGNHENLGKLLEENQETWVTLEENQENLGKPSEMQKILGKTWRILEKLEGNHYTI